MLQKLNHTLNVEMRVSVPEQRNLKQMWRTYLSFVIYLRRKVAPNSPNNTLDVAIANNKEEKKVVDPDNCLKIYTY